MTALDTTSSTEPVGITESPGGQRVGIPERAPAERLAPLRHQDPKGLKPHSHAVLVSMIDEQFEALLADIKVWGFRDPVVLYKGQILDGVHRYRIWELLGGAAPDFVEYVGEHPLDYVISANYCRRHLSAGQLACIGYIHYLPEEQEAAHERMAMGGRESTPGRPRKGSDSGRTLSLGRSVDRAGKRVGVSGKAIDRAGIIHEYRYDLFELVWAGKMDLAPAWREAMKVKREAEGKLPEFAAVPREERAPGRQRQLTQELIRMLCKAETSLAKTPESDREFVRIALLEIERRMQRCRDVFEGREPTPLPGTMLSGEKPRRARRPRRPECVGQQDLGPVVASPTNGTEPAEGGIG